MNNTSSRNNKADLRIAPNNSSSLFAPSITTLDSSLVPIITSSTSSPVPITVDSLNLTNNNSNNNINNNNNKTEQMPDLPISTPRATSLITSSLDPIISYLQTQHQF